MPELRNFTGDRSLGVSVDWNTYSYKDKQREKRRKEILQESAENGGTSQQNPKKRTASESVAWSHNAEDKEKKFKRREQKKARKEKTRWENMPAEERERVLQTENMVEEIRKKNEQQRLLKRTAKDEAADGNEEEFKGFS